MSLKNLFLALVLGSQFLYVLGQTYTPSSNQYISNALGPFINPITLFDGPASVAQALTTTTNPTPDLDKLKYYNYFAASTYCPYQLGDLSCEYCQHFNSDVSYHTVFTNTTYDTIALITVHPDKQEIVVTFRGSVALLNLILDFTMLPYPGTEGIKLHLGFYLCTQSLYSQVVTVLQTQLQLNPNYHVVITGHSLGAAMASLTTFFLKQTNQFPNVNYTLIGYGEPRAGNKPYANYMNNLGISMARVVARADVIAHVMPVSAFGIVNLLFTDYYVHHAREVWINGTETRFCTLTKYEDDSCSNTMGPNYSIVDHTQYFDANYLKCYLAGDPADINLASIPGVLIPTDVIPPFPNLQGPLAGVVGTVSPLIDPLLG